MELEWSPHTFTTCLRHSLPDENYNNVSSRLTLCEGGGGGGGGSGRWLLMMIITIN